MLKNSTSDYQLSDEDLVLMYRSTQDSRYVGLLFERYTDVIFGVSLKYLKDRHDAEDMMSTIFEKLVETLKEKEVERFRNWLFVLVKNQCVSLLRSEKADQNRKQRYDEYLSRLMIAEEFSGIRFDSMKERDRYEQRMNILLSGLPEKQLLCIRYFYFEDLTYRDIAELLGEKVGKIRSYIQNGRRNLKLMLEKSKH